MCGIPPGAAFRISRINKEACDGVDINLVPQHLFYPVGWFDFTALYSEMRSKSEWEDFFSESLAAHMYFSAGKKKKILREKFYGSKVPAYLYLASKYCPVSQQSAKIF